MAIKITKAADPIRVSRLNVCIYGQPGAGKTTLAFTASKPLLLDFDKGAHRAAGRKDSVQVDTWADVATLSAADVKDYDAIILDTAGRALDTLTADIIRREPKLGRGGVLTLQGYGKLKTEFAAFLKMLNSYGKDVILIAHMDEKQNGDDIIERLDVQGSSKSEIYKAADAMGRIFIKGNHRVLDFSPREGSFGKNPGQLEPMDIPDIKEDPAFLETVIQSIKDKLNTLSEAQVERQKLLEDWNAKIGDCDTVESINELVGAAPDDKAIKGMIHAKATDLGFTFNARERGYVAPATESEAA